MSSHYIAYVYITLGTKNKDTKFKPEDKVFIEKQIGLMVKNDILNEATCQDSEDYFYFELSGTNGIDYSYLEKIRDKIKDNYKQVEIQATEYNETGDGFYFNNEDI